MYNDFCRAEVAELADAQASGACGSNVVWVQVPSPAFPERERAEVSELADEQD